MYRIKTSMKGKKWKVFRDRKSNKNIRGDRIISKAGINNFACSMKHTWKELNEYGHILHE